MNKKTYISPCVRMTDMEGVTLLLGSTGDSFNVNTDKLGTDTDDSHKAKIDTPSYDF